MGRILPPFVASQLLHEIGQLHWHGARDTGPGQQLADVTEANVEFRLPSHHQFGLALRALPGDASRTEINAYGRSD